MKFDDASAYTLISPTGDRVYWTNYQLALFIHVNNLDYKYIPRTSRKGVLELYSDEVDEVFDVILHQ